MRCSRRESSSLFSVVLLSFQSTEHDPEFWKFLCGSRDNVRHAEIVSISIPRKINLWTVLWCHTRTEILVHVAIRSMCIIEMWIAVLFGGPTDRKLSKSCSFVLDYQLSNDIHADWRASLDHTKMCSSILVLVRGMYRDYCGMQSVYWLKCSNIIPAGWPDPLRWSLTMPLCLYLCGDDRFMIIKAVALGPSLVG